MTIKTRKTATTNGTAEAAKESKTLSRVRKPSADQVAKAKTDDILEAASDAQALAPAQAPQSEQGQSVALEGLDRPVTGRGVFAVRTLGNAVSVEAAFLAEDGNVLRLPAVFPNRQYAQSQLEELWQIVNKHFDELDELSAKGSN